MYVIWFDFVDDDTASIIKPYSEVPVIPSIGESAGLLPTPAGGDTFILHKVVDVRHYWQNTGMQEVHVMLSESP